MTCYPTHRFSKLFRVSWKVTWEPERSKWYYPSHGDDLELEGDKVIKTAPEENRRRRTIILYRLNNSWGFSLQSYGIHHRKKDEMELMTYVDHVEQGGAAYQAGMRPGDVILSINGKSMEDVPHKDMVQFIKQTGDTMRVVVLFENCCKKVELHMKYLKLQRTVAEKMFELRSLELQEKRVLKGLPQFDCSRSSRSNSTCSLNSSIQETRSLVPELDRCPSPLLSPSSKPRTAEPETESSKLDVLESLKIPMTSGKLPKTRSMTGSMIDLSELKRRRRTKRRPLNSLSERRHFQLSPLGGAKSKVLVERLPPEVDGVAVVNDGENSKRSSANGEVRSLESRLAELILGGDETSHDVPASTCDDNLKREGTHSKTKSRTRINPRKDVNSNIMSKSLTETGTFDEEERETNMNKSIPCLLSSSKRGSNGLRVKPLKCMNMLMKQEMYNNKNERVRSSGSSKLSLKRLPGNTSTDSSPDVSVESPTSSEEYYQTFIEGDLDSPVTSPKLNMSTHPALMKSDSEPINIRHSLEFQSKPEVDWEYDEVILPSPIKKEGNTDVIFDLHSPLDSNYTSKRSISMDDSVSPKKLLQTQNSNSLSLSPGELANRDSDVSLMSMDSEASRFSYADLPGIDISFVNDDTHVTEF